MVEEKKTIEEKITKYIYSNFIYDSSIKFNNNKSLTKSGYVDSMGIIEIIDFITNTFNIDIPDSELTPKNLDTIEGCVNLVLKLKNN